MVRRGRSRGALGWVGLVVVLVAGTLPVVASESAAPASVPASTDLSNYQPRNVAVQPVSDEPPKQPRPPVPALDLKPGSGDALINAKGGKVAIDGLPVSLRVDRGAVPDDMRVRVEVLDPKAGAQLTKLGYAFRVTFQDDASKKTVQPDGQVLMDVDYSAVEHQYGGDFVSRLRVTSVPECRVDAAEKGTDSAAADPACLAGRLLVTQKNDRERSTLTVDVGPGGLQPVDAGGVSVDEDGRVAEVAGTDPVSDSVGAASSTTGSTTTTTPTPSTTATTTPGAKSTTEVPIDGSAAPGTVDESSTTSTTTATASTTTTAPQTDAAGPDAAASAALAPARVGGAGGGRFALTSGTTGDSGDYAATPTAGVGSSSVGLQSGSAESAYLINMPPAAAGATPKVSLQYSSASVDGFTSDRNTQASEVGIGWQLNVGSITREFKACNLMDAPGDLCWAGENYQITLNGVSDRLIPVIGSNNSLWRLEHEPYWRVERILSSDATYLGLDQTAPNQFAYFQVTTPDGTRYRFGGEMEPGMNVHQNSVWHVPVYNPGQNDPCYSHVPDRMCQEAYRWNLDRVQDTSGNVASYFYTVGVNYYNVRFGLTASPWTDWPYTSAGYLSQIQYSKISGSEALTTTGTGRCSSTRIVARAPVRRRPISWTPRWICCVCPGIRRARRGALRSGGCCASTRSRRR